LGWAGPAQPAGPDSAPKVLGRSRPKNGLGRFRPKYYYSLLGQTRPRRQVWARIRLDQAKTGGGELFSPHPCMQRRKKKINARMRGKKSYLWRGGDGVSLVCRLRWWRCGGGCGGVLAHGRRLQAAAAVLCFFSVFP